MNGGAILWSNYLVDNSSGFSNHEDIIQQLVSLGLKDAIASVGLAEELECINEHSLFRLRADMLIVVVKKSGVPVGVIEIKNDQNLDHHNGQILDYMLRLKSFNGLQSVFGVVTTYRCWHICWLPDCDGIAAAEQVPVPALLGQPPKEEIEMDTEDNKEDLSIVPTSENQ